MAECLLCSDLADRGGFIDLPHGFAVAADAAPLGPGHTLLHTRDHFPSFAAIGSERLLFAKKVLQQVTAVDFFAGSGFLAFEHGTSGVSSAAYGCVDHAHIHLLPLTGHAITARAALDTFPSELANAGAAIRFEELADLASTEYFWIADRNLEPILFRPNRPERQILRRLIASALRLPSHRTWDLYDLDAAKATTFTLRDHFSETDRGAR